MTTEARKPKPVSIKLKTRSRQLEIIFDDDICFEMDFEFLRVHSPSAEVKGHGPGQAVLQTGKESVTITDIEPIGHYAIRLNFDDGHGTGHYSWDYLYELGQNQPRLWQEYLNALQEAGINRKT